MNIKSILLKLKLHRRLTKNEKIGNLSSIILFSTAFTIMSMLFFSVIFLDEFTNKFDRNDMTIVINSIDGNVVEISPEFSIALENLRNNGYHVSYEWLMGIENTRPLSKLS